MNDANDKNRLKLLTFKYLSQIRYDATYLFFLSVGLSFPLSDSIISNFITTALWVFKCLLKLPAKDDA